ncbi:MAG: hypothetical protein LBK25_00005 [Treponema sp.]|nr:hypothetical protein [Treponema sp.]
MVSAFTLGNPIFGFRHLLNGRCLKRRCSHTKGVRHPTLETSPSRCQS